MLIFVKGRPGTGKTTFSRRLAEHLELPPPAWPVDAATLAEIRAMVGEWEEIDDDYYRGEGHVNTDKAASLCFFELRERLPPLPPAGAPAEAFGRWVGESSAALGSGPGQARLLELLRELIDSTPHAVVDGTLLGLGEGDTNIARMLRFVYSRAPIVEVVLDRDPYDGPEPPAEARWVARMGGEELSHDEALARLARHLAEN